MVSSFPANMPATPRESRAVEDTLTPPGRGPGSPHLCWMGRPRKRGPHSRLPARECLSWGPLSRKPHPLHCPRQFLKVFDSGPQLGTVWRKQCCPGFFPYPDTQARTPQSLLGLRLPGLTPSTHIRQLWASPHIHENQKGLCWVASG